MLKKWFNFCKVLFHFFHSLHYILLKQNIYCWSHSMQFSMELENILPTHYIVFAEISYFHDNDCLENMLKLKIDEKNVFICEQWCVWITRMSIILYRKLLWYKKKKWNDKHIRKTKSKKKNINKMAKLLWSRWRRHQQQNSVTIVPLKSEKETEKKAILFII